MKVEDLKNMIKQSLNEAKADLKKKNVKKEKKEEKLPKSSGKLMDLKKEYQALKTMKEELLRYSINENIVEVEPSFSHMVKYVNELKKIKESISNLSTSIDSKLSETKNRITAEKEKIREMIGLSNDSDDESIKGE